MKAIVLVGGEGTRLRPFTPQTPKALVPVLNRPLLERLLLHLHHHGVTHVTLAMTGRSEAVRAAFGDGMHLGLTLDYAYEETPLGSGGAIASIASTWDERFIVCNGDIVTNLDLGAMLELHGTSGAELSISLHEVDDPSPFGVVDLEEDGRVQRFVEKPPREEAPSHLINAGTWIFEPSVVRELDGTRFNRVEEALFVDLAAAGRAIYGFHLPASWADVGNPAALLRVNLALAQEASEAATLAFTGRALAEDVYIGPAATVEAPSVVGAGSTVEEGACVTESLLWDDVHVGPCANVSQSILASGVRIGAGAVVLDSLVAQDAVIGPGVHVTGATVEAGAQITTSPDRKVVS